MDLPLLALSLIAWLWPAPLALVLLALAARCLRPLRRFSASLAVGSLAFALVLGAATLLVRFSPSPPSPATNLPLFLILFVLAPSLAALLLLRPAAADRT